MSPDNMVEIGVGIAALIPILTQLVAVVGTPKQKLIAAFINAICGNYGKSKNKDA